MKTAPAHALVVALLAVVLLAAALVGVTATGAGAAQRTAPRPNILFVLTDDLAAGDEAHMPNTQKLVADAGASFANYFVSDSVCCPSRMTTLRGQFAHNTGVKTNGGSNGGFDTAYLSGVEHDTIATTCRARATGPGCSASISTSTRAPRESGTSRPDGPRGRARSAAIRTSSATTC